MALDDLIAFAGLLLKSRPIQDVDDTPAVGDQTLCLEVPGCDCDAKHSMQATCFMNEDYYADRIGNDVIVYGANGRVTYHLTGSWDAFEAGTLHRADE